MPQCNPWFNSKTVSEIKSWIIFSLRYDEREIQTYMYTLSLTYAHTCYSTCFAISKFSICEMYYSLQNRSHGFSCFFIFLLFFTHTYIYIYSHNIAIYPRVWWQATKWISNIHGTSEAPEPNCKLETHSWLLHQQKRFLMCDSTHHPS